MISFYLGLALLGAIAATAVHHLSSEQSRRAALRPVRIHADGRRNRR